jgi:hypothetical protein
VPRVLLYADPPLVVQVCHCTVDKPAERRHHAYHSCVLQQQPCCLRLPAHGVDLPECLGCMEAAREDANLCTESGEVPG